MSAYADVPADLRALLEQWVGEGLLSDEQAERILRWEQRTTGAAGRRGADALPLDRPGGAGSRVSLLTEALGYLGAALIVVGAVLIAGQLWAELTDPVRLALLAAAAVLLLAAGLAVPERLGPVGTRLRAVLLTMSVVAVAALLALVGTDLLGWESDGVAVLVAAGSALYAGVLWSRRPSVLQQAVFFVALSGAAATTAARYGPNETWVPGLAVWGVALTWLAMAWRGWLSSRDAAYALGSVGAVFGAVSMATMGWGHVLALVTTLALVAAAVAVGDLVVLGVGALGTLLVLPGTVAYFFPGALAAPVALVAAGVLLVAAAVRAARRRETRLVGVSQQAARASPREGASHGRAG
jgi:hypothetical protein